MKKLLLLITAFYTVTISGSFAQTLVIGKSSTEFPATIDSLNPTFNLTFWVINEDSTLTKPETINIEFRIKNSPYSKAVEFTGSAPADTFGHGDSVKLTCTYTPPSDTQFFVGDDVVVVWPTGSGGIALVGDSIIDTITVTSTAGISSFINSSFKIALYPNPTEALLYLNYDESIIHLEQVRIYDLLGRTMLTTTSSFNTIDINSLPDGVYFLEAINTDESRYITQFVKTR